MAVMKVGAAGIETISGAMKKPKKQNGHNHGNYMIAVHRTAPTENPNCQRVYVKDADAYQRTTPLTADETAARIRFTAVSRAVKIRAKDLSHISDDQVAFLAQRNQPNGKKTMRAYLWLVCGQEYDNEQG